MAFRSGDRGVRIELPRLCEKLVLSKMAFIDGERADDPLGHFRVMRLTPRNELLHLAAHAFSSAEDEDLAGGLQRLGHRLEEAVRVRLFLASRKILRVIAHGESSRLAHAAESAAEPRRAFQNGKCGPRDDRSRAANARPASFVSARYRLRPFKKVTQGHHFILFGDILRARWMQDECLAVPCHLQFAIRFLCNGAQLPK